MSPGCVALQTTQAPVRPVAKGQSLKATWERDTLRAQVEPVAEGRCLRAARQLVTVQGKHRSGHQGKPAPWRMRSVVDQSGCARLQPNSGESSRHRSMSPGCAASRHLASFRGTRSRRLMTAGCLQLDTSQALVDSQGPRTLSAGCWAA
jgi:hypothetical protein